MPEDFIDNLAKENLIGNNIDYNPADWDKMAAMLDAGQPKPFILKNWLALSAVLLSLLVVTSLILFNNSPKPEMETGIRNGIFSFPAGEIAKESGSKSQLGHNQQIPILNDSSPNKQALANTYSDNNIIDRESSALNGSQAVKKLPTKLAEENSKEHASNKTKQETQVEFSSHTVPKNFVKNYSIKLSAMDPMEVQLEDAILISQTPNIPHTSQSRNKKPLDFGMHFSPDANIVNGIFPGFTSGITFQYPINNHLTLQFDGSFTQKHYTANYPILVPHFTNNLVLEKSEGTLNMLDISINAKYSIGFPNRLKPFVKFGLGVLVPIKEKYIFYYQEGPVIPPVSALGSSNQVTEEYSVNAFNSGKILAFDASGNLVQETYNLKPLLGIAKIGAGVDYYLNPKFILSVEPLLTVPFQKLGLEEKGIQTLGLNMGIRYRLVR